MRDPSKLRKKGLEMGVVMIYVLGAVMMVLVILIVDRFYDTAKEKMEIQNCRNSIGAHALLAKTSQREVFTDIKCQTREERIDARNHEKAKKEIAESMRRCWYEWQKGDAQLFKGEGVFCHVCSIYDFKQKDEKIAQFLSFLMTEDIEIRSVYPEDTQKMKYIDYFQDFSTEKIEYIEEMPNASKITFKDTTTIDTSKKYATIFVYASGKTAMDEFLEGGGRTTAGAIGAGVAVTSAIGLGLGLVKAGAAIAAGGGPPGWVIGGITAAVGGIALGITAVYLAATPEEPQWISMVQFMEYNATQINDLGCQYLDVNQLSHQQP